MPWLLNLIRTWSIRPVQDGKTLFLTTFFVIGIFPDIRLGVVWAERMVFMKHKFLITIAALILTLAASLGFAPAWLGLVGNVVLNELDNIEVTPEAFEPYLVNVTRIIDGDTIEVTMSSTTGESEMLRLIGVDTPETKHPRLPVQFFGPEAAQFVTNLCDGKAVVLHFQKTGPRRGSYGRLLVYVELESGLILNEEIIRRGFGYSYTKYPHEKTAEYNLLQDGAQAAGRGLWGSVKFEDLPGWLREANPDILK